MTTRETQALVRLRVANPVAGDEPLAPIEETEAILARLLATPPDALAPAVVAARGRRWRLRIAIVGVAFAAAASVLVAILPTGGESAHDVLARAEAALSDDDTIYHFVEVDEFLDENGSVVRRLHSETWVSGDQRRLRALLFADEGGERGGVTGETVVSKGAVRDYRVATNKITEYDLPADPLRRPFRPRGFHGEAAGAPNAKVDTIDYQGRKAVRVTVASGSGGIRHTLIVDAKTYLPMLFELSSNNVQYQQPYSFRFPTYERLDANAETQKLLEMSPHPGAKTIRKPFEKTLRTRRRPP